GLVACIENAAHFGADSRGALVRLSRLGESRDVFEELGSVLRELVHGLAIRCHGPWYALCSDTTILLPHLVLLVLGFAHRGLSMHYQLELHQGQRHLPLWTPVSAVFNQLLFWRSEGFEVLGRLGPVLPQQS